MGAAWIDYLVADAVVTPVEHARHSYLSKLLLMPVTYQVNYYPREDYVRIGADDRINGDQQKQAPSPKRAAVDPRFEDAIDIDEDDPCLPCRTASFVFCNFNKNDKLDPESFTVWMNVLRAVPGSILWLLAPSRAAGNGGAILRNLRREAAARGVAPSRLVFAPRRTKRAHLERMKHADLFLDSFVYGAHSTATDALRGGLPVLTVRGDNFASRVATSLLLNVGCRRWDLPVRRCTSAWRWRWPEVRCKGEAGQTKLEDTATRLALSGVRKGHAEMSGVLGVLTTNYKRFPPSNTPSLSLRRRSPSESPRRMPRFVACIKWGTAAVSHCTTRTRLSAVQSACTKCELHCVATGRKLEPVPRLVLIAKCISLGAEGLHTMTVEHGWALERGSTKAESAEPPPRGITAFEGAGEIELLTI